MWAKDGWEEVEDEARNFQGFNLIKKEHPAASSGEYQETFSTKDSWVKGFQLPRGFEIVGVTFDFHSLTSRAPMFIIWAKGFIGDIDYDFSKNELFAGKSKSKALSWLNETIGGHLKLPTEQEISELQERNDPIWPGESWIDVSKTSAHPPARMSKNELRKMIGLNPIDGWDDAPASYSEVETVRKIVEDTVKDKELFLSSYAASGDDGSQDADFKSESVTLGSGYCPFVLMTDNVRLIDTYDAGPQYADYSFALETEDEIDAPVYVDGK